MLILMFLLFYRSYISSATRRLPPSQYWNFVFIRLGSWSLVNSYKQKTKTEPPIPESFWNIYTGGRHARFGVQMYLGYILVLTYQILSRLMKNWLCRTYFNFTTYIDMMFHFITVKKWHFLTFGLIFWNCWYWTPNFFCMGG